MFQKVLWILCSLAVANAGVIGTDYSPATLVSYSSISAPVVTKTYSTPTIEKTVTAPIEYTKIIKTSPVYESVLTTQESNVETPDGAQHTTYSKSLDTWYPSINKYESQASKNGDVLTHVPTIYTTGSHSPVIYHHPDTVSSSLYNSVASPDVTKSISIPFTYTTHNGPFTKTISAPSITSYSTPVISSGLPTFSTHTPVIQAQSVTKAQEGLTYTTHDIPLTKTVPSHITSYTPVLEQNKVLSSTYQSHIPEIEAQTITKSFPVTYTTHSIPVTKTVSAPALTSYTPILEQNKVLSSSYYSHIPATEAQTVSKSFPVTYTTYNIPLTKTVSAPTVTYTPVVEKTKVVSSRLSQSSPLVEDQPLKTTFTYSSAPIVSRMSFSGLGTSYAW